MLGDTSCRADRRCVRLTSNVMTKGQRPGFFPVHRIEKTGSEESDQRRSESSSSYPPSLLSLPNNRWLVADGRLSIDLVQTQRQGRRWTATCQISRQCGPGRLLSATVTKDGKAVNALVQRSRRPEASSRQSTGSSSKQTVFEVATVRLPLADDSSEPAAEANWSGNSETPAYQAMERSSETEDLLLLSETPFESAPAAEQSEQVSSSHASSSQLETENAAPTEETNSKTSQLATRPPQPFSWLQTDDSLTLVFQLPPSITSKDIRVHFSPQGLSIHLAEGANLYGENKIVELGSNGEAADAQDDGSHSAMLGMRQTANSILAGKYANRALWAAIVPGDSVWTWEKMGGHVAGAVQGGSARPEKGLLTIHLDKKDVGVRWSHVFDQKKRKQSAEAGKEPPKRPMIGGDRSATRQDDTARVQEAEESEGYAEAEERGEAHEDAEDEPPETVDPSELLMMLEGLEKYTVDGQGDEPAIERPGFERESLLHDRMEPEDNDVGRPLCVSRFADANGGGITSGALEINGRPTSCLALPLPQAGSPGAQAVVVRNELDGLVASSARWRHVDTLPGLSFVLASKRDLRGVWVHTRGAQPLDVANESDKTTSTALAPPHQSVVLAFESAPTTSSTSSSASLSAREDAARSAGNLFVYYSPPLVTASDSQGNHSSTTNAKQVNAPSRVLRLGVDGKGEDEGEEGGESSEGGSGAFMGVAAVSYGSDSDDEGHMEKKRSENAVVLCVLCERKLLVLDGIL